MAAVQDLRLKGGLEKTPSTQVHKQMVEKNVSNNQVRSHLYKTKGDGCAFGL